MATERPSLFITLQGVAHTSAQMPPQKDWLLRHQIMLRTVRECDTPGAGTGTESSGSVQVPADVKKKLETEPELEPELEPEPEPEPELETEPET
jgi:hypothetical protein